MPSPKSTVQYCTILYTTPSFPEEFSTLSSNARGSASHAVLSRMQVTLHETRRTPLHASRLVRAMSVWSTKTRHAASRYWRDARVYGHTTTAMLEIEYTPRPLPPSPASSRDT